MGQIRKLRRNLLLFVNRNEVGSSTAATTTRSVTASTGCFPAIGHSGSATMNGSGSVVATTTLSTGRVDHCGNSRAWRNMQLRLGATAFDIVTYVGGKWFAVNAACDALLFARGFGATGVSRWLNYFRIPGSGAGLSSVSAIAPRQAE